MMYDSLDNLAAIRPLYLQVEYSRRQRIAAMLGDKELDKSEPVTYSKIQTKEIREGRKFREVNHDSA